jgi:hypothetical protein
VDGIEDCDLLSEAGLLVGLGVVQCEELLVLTQSKRRLDVEIQEASLVLLQFASRGNIVDFALERCDVTISSGKLDAQLLKLGLFLSQLLGDGLQNKAKE